MDVEGTVTGTGNEQRVHLHVRADKAGRIIGKRGSTLSSIRQLLRLALEPKFGDLVIDVDIPDDRPRTERPMDAGPRPHDRGRGPRDRRGGRGGRDRGDRGDRDYRGDRGDRDYRGDRGGEEGRHPEPKLRELARRAAEKAIETGRTITINLDLNSYDRRIVHLEISEIEGVASRSEERDGVKRIQVIPAAAS
jgi:predicted RNA-binding protein Jag